MIAVPEIVGVLSLVIWGAMVGIAGAVVSMINSATVASAVTLPAASLTLTFTS